MFTYDEAEVRCRELLSQYLEEGQITTQEDAARLLIKMISTAAHQLAHVIGPLQTASVLAGVAALVMEAFQAAPHATH